MDVTTFAMGFSAGFGAFGLLWTLKLRAQAAELRKLSGEVNELHEQAGAQLASAQEALELAEAMQSEAQRKARYLEEQDEARRRRENDPKRHDGRLGVEDFLQARRYSR